MKWALHVRKIRPKWLFIVIGWLTLGIGIASPFSAFAYSRIISLKPNLTEILFELGLGPELVGVTQWCKRPEAVKSLPKVADYLQAFPEPILQLKPDLVIGTKENGSEKEIRFLLDRGIPVLTLGSSQNSSPQEVGTLKTRGISVDSLGFENIEGTMLSIEALGALLGKDHLAKDITAKMRKELATLKTEAEAVPKTRVLYVVGYQPLVVAGANNFFDEAGDYIGAINVARQSKLKYPYYSTEGLIRSAPDVILDFAMGSESSEAAKLGRAGFWKQFPSIPAVKNGRIFALDIETMRAVPSLPATLRDIFRLLHPRSP